MVIANLATQPSRSDIAPKAIESILPHIDVLNIWLNSYSKKPKWLPQSSKIHTCLDEFNYRAERGKFVWVDRVAGYYFTIDDDIIYPPDYISKMIEAIERHYRKAIVCVHGNIVKKSFGNYYDGKSRECVIFKEALSSDIPVDFPGTGTVAFHTDTIQFSAMDLECPFMADIWLGIIAKRNRVPVIAVKRQANWLQPIFTKGIFEKVMKDEVLREQQTNLIIEYLNMEAA